MPLCKRAETAQHTPETANGAGRPLQSDASATLHGLDALIADSRRQIDTRGNEPGRTMASAERTMNQAETVPASVNSLIEPRAQVRSNLDAAIRDLAAGASSRRGFVQTVERDPSVLVMERQSR